LIAGERKRAGLDARTAWQEQQQRARLGQVQTDGRLLALDGVNLREAEAPERDGGEGQHRESAAHSVPLVVVRRVNARGRSSTATPPGAMQIVKHRATTVRTLGVTSKPVLRQR
jgi:hypothetical protein